MGRSPRAAPEGSARVAAAPDFTAAAEQIERWLAQGYYPGASLIVGAGDEVLLERYWGSHGPGATEYIASAGKWLAAAAIASVVDRGLLSYADSIGQWLPQFAGQARSITLRQLLSHTSGLAEQLPAGQRPDDYQSLEESVAHIAAVPLADQPGTCFRYGALALQVAGRMAELATGLSFDALFQASMAVPLGLQETRFTPVDASPGHNPMLSGGARSSARDYARFLAMLANAGELGGVRVLSAAATEEMSADQVGSARLAASDLVRGIAGGTHTGVYALGSWRERLDAGGRAVKLSSPGWAGTYPWLDRARGVFGVLLAHVDLALPRWEPGFNPLYSSATLAELVAEGFERTA